MIEHHDPWDALWKLMEEDTVSYQALLEDMGQEWESLKKDDLSSLLPLLHAKETHIQKVKVNRESVAQILDGLLGERVKKDQPRVLSDLLPSALPAQAQKIKSYLVGSERLRRQIMAMNERNKRFIQETLDYFKSIFSLFTSSGQEEPAYVQKGKPVFTPLPPCWMNREV